MDKLNAFIEQLELKIPKQELVNEMISKSSVGWHIEHTLLVVDTVIENLQKSDPATYQWKFNFTRTLIFSINKIPRSKVQSPKSVRPKNDFNEEMLTMHVSTTKDKIKTLKSLQPNHYFDHPFFGNLNLKPAIKFLLIHTKHHINIINDIVKK